MTKPSEFARDLSAQIQTKVALRQIFNKGVLDRIATETVKAIKADIAAGKSPIEGKGNFPPYKNPKKYPGKRKPARPVNLFLLGQFQGALRFTTNVTKTAISIFYSGRLAEKKEEGHRIGWNKQPKRPSLPKGDEQFNAGIRKKISAMIDDAVRKASLTWK